MKQPYCLGIDVWEGQLEIDEAVLKANGVKFIFVRLNDISGGTHKDETFDKQWNEAAGFYRAPYFVYNPWVSGQTNFDFLARNMPPEAKLVALDIEVVYAGISAVAYAAEVGKFCTLVKAKWNCVIYTGEWFLKYLSTWPEGDYWWAQFPILLYPTNTTSITWAQFRGKLDTFEGPLNVSKCPGTVRIWQCSADRFILPGSTRKMDVNVFFGDETALAKLFGSPVVEPPSGDDMGITDAMWNALLVRLDNIQRAIEDLDISGEPDPDPEPEPDPNPEPEPEPDPVPNDGYIGPDMGVYRVIEAADQQAGNTITTIQDSYGNEVTIIMDKMVAWMEAHCPGWSDFVKNGSVVQRPDGLWQYEVKVVKGQLLRIAEVGGKTTKNPLGNGRIIGMDSEGDPTHGAVNMSAVSHTLTPWYFHKIPNVPRYFPIVQPRQAKNMTVLNAWWIPMRWLEKVS